MSEQRDDTHEVYYFVTLETWERQDHFQDDAFRTQVEVHWAETMRKQAALSGEEYAVNDHALHALVLIQGPGDELELLNAATGAFMELVVEDWQGAGELWSPSHKFRRIREEQELRSLRDFIVQKMLGGKELSEIEDEDENDDWY